MSQQTHRVINPETTAKSVGYTQVVETSGTRTVYI